MKCSAPDIHTGAGKALARVGISKDRLWSRSDRGASAGLETNLETQIFLHKYSSHGFHDPLCHRNYRECPQAIVSWDSLSTLPTLTLRPLQKEFAAPGFIFAGFSLLWQNHLTSCTYFREPGVEFALAVQVVWSTLNSAHSLSLLRNQIDCLGGALPGNRDVCVGLRCLSCETKIKLFFRLLLFFT